MKTVLKLSLLVGISVSMASCFDKSSPNYQYMPNMYESVAYETYSEHEVFGATGQQAQLPAEGSVKRGFVPYDIPNTNEGYEASKANVNPLATEEKDMVKAKALYDVYCGVCHGEKGDGKGILVQKEKYLGVPHFADRAVTEGSVYHVQTYGLNAMGSYANQLSQKERWMIASYVMQLKAGN